MLRPSPSELLAGVADALDSTVLDELARGPARNQLVAAIGIVRRCAAAVEHHGPLLHADVADLVVSLPQIVAGDPALVPEAGRAELEEALAAARRVLDEAYPPVTVLLAADLSLQRVVADVGVEAERTGSPQAAVLAELFARMTARQAELGLSPW